MTLYAHLALFAAVVCAVARAEPQQLAKKTVPGPLRQATLTGETGTSALTTASAAITGTPSCMGKTLHAPNANLLYWDTDVHQWALSSLFCLQNTAHMMTGWTTLYSSFDFPSFPTTTERDSYDAAATLVVTTAAPIDVGTYLSSWITTTTKTITESGTTRESAEVITTTESTVYTRQTGGAPNISTVTATMPNMPDVTIPPAAPAIYYSVLEVEEATQVDGSCVMSTLTTTLATPYLGHPMGNGSVPWSKATEALGQISPQDLTKISRLLGVGSLGGGSYTGLPTVIVASESMYVTVCPIGLPFQILTPATVLVTKTSARSPGASEAGTEPAGQLPAFAPTTAPNIGSQANPTPAPYPGEPQAPALNSPTPAALNPAPAPPGNGNPAEPPPAVFTYASITFTADASSAFTIASQRLAPGSAITVSGTLISLAPSATAVVIDNSFTIPIAKATPLPVTGPPMTTATLPASILEPGATVAIDGQTLSVLPNGVPTVDGMPLLPGKVVIVDGVTLSLQQAGGPIVAVAPVSSLGPQSPAVPGDQADAKGSSSALPSSPMTAPGATPAAWTVLASGSAAPTSPRGGLGAGRVESSAPRLAGRTGPASCAAVQVLVAVLLVSGAL